MAHETEYGVYLKPDEWRIVSDCILIVDEERSGELDSAEDRVNRKIQVQLEKQGVNTDRG